MSNLRTSNIPAGIVPETPVDRPLELFAGMGFPYEFGDLRIPPLSIGTAAVLELGAVQVFRTQDISDTWGVAKLIYALCEREKAAPLFFRWRKWMESDAGKVFSLEDVDTWSELDFEVERFASKHEVFSNKNYTASNLIGLFEFVFVGFNGFLMIPEIRHNEPKWWFDMPAVAASVLSLCGSANVGLFEALWRVPLALSSHITAASLKASGVKHIDRPASKEFINEMHRVIFEREMKGKLHPWQIMDPVGYDLSSLQLKMKPDLGNEYARMRDKFASMKPEKKKEFKDKHWKNVLKDVEKIKQKIGLKE